LTAIRAASHADLDEGAAERLRCRPRPVPGRRVYGLSEAPAAGTAATLDLPLALTKRGCIVYATKGA
jgi:hypothetical protein